MLLLLLTLLYFFFGQQWGIALWWILILALSSYQRVAGAFAMKCQLVYYCYYLCVYLLRFVAALKRVQGVWAVVVVVVVVVFFFRVSATLGYLFSFN